MRTLKVGIREFRQKLARYLPETDKSLVITRDGAVGYYLAARRKRSEAEQSALRHRAPRLQETLAAEGLTENEMIADFRRWRAGGRQWTSDEGWWSTLIS